MATTITIVPAPYKLFETKTNTQGQCITCGWDASRITRWYRNLHTGEEHFVSVRTRCICPNYQQERDPYKQYAQPMDAYSHEQQCWLHPHWNDETGKWDMIPD